MKSLLLAALCCLAIVAITGTAVAQSSNSSLDARIDGPRNPSMGELARFSGSDSSGDIVEYRWYVNGERRTGRTLRYRFQNTGRYDVELTVEGPDGRTDRTTKTVVVRFEPRCTVSKTDIRPGDRVTIDASKSRGATYYRYSKYGDGSYTRWTRSDSKTFRYEDPVEKRFSPDLEIAGRDKNNINGDSCPTINVRQREPVSRFEVRPDTPDVGQKVVIDARDSEPPRNGRIVKYEYDVDGDNRFEYDNRNGVLKYSYDSKGRRIIRV
ncbi:MAG: PKD domain-containing protein, partial [Halobacteria archaeon]